MRRWWWTRREAVRTLDHDMSEALRVIRLRLDGLQAQIEHVEELGEYHREDAGKDRETLGADVRLLREELRDLGYRVDDAENIASQAKEAAERADRGW